MVARVVTGRDPRRLSVIDGENFEGVRRLLKEKKGRELEMEMLGRRVRFEAGIETSN